MNQYFNRFAETTSRALGSAWAFVIALGVVLLWALSGPAFHYNDAWQLTINTGTTIVTFLMVFLIQNSRNREARTTRLKIDELLRAVVQARTSLVNVQDLSDQELDALESEFRRLGRSNAEDATGTSTSELRKKIAERIPSDDAPARQVRYRAQVMNDRVASYPGSLDELQAHRNVAPTSK